MLMFLYQYSELFTGDARDAVFNTFVVDRHFFYFFLHWDINVRNVCSPPFQKSIPTTLFPPLSLARPSTSLSRTSCFEQGGQSSRVMGFG